MLQGGTGPATSTGSRPAADVHDDAQVGLVPVDAWIAGAVVADRCGRQDDVRLGNGDVADVADDRALPRRELGLRHHARGAAVAGKRLRVEIAERRHLVLEHVDVDRAVAEVLILAAAVDALPGRHLHGVDRLGRVVGDGEGVAAAAQVELAVGVYPAVQRHVGTGQDLEVVLVEGDELEERDVADEELGAHGGFGVADVVHRLRVDDVAVLDRVEAGEDLAGGDDDVLRIPDALGELVGDGAVADRQRARVEVIAVRHVVVEEDVAVLAHAGVEAGLGGVEPGDAPIEGAAELGVRARPPAPGRRPATSAGLRGPARR